MPPRDPAPPALPPEIEAAVREAVSLPPEDDPAFLEVLSERYAEEYWREHKGLLTAGPEEWGRTDS